MQQLIDQIEQWAEDRNLINGSTPQKQMLKLMEEFGELCGGIARNNPEMVKDAIGDCFVVLIILNKQIRTGYCIADEYNNQIFSRFSIDDLILEITTFLGKISYNIMWNKSDIRLFKGIVCCLYHISNRLNLDFINCVQHAYDQIKDRRGKMINGVFVKEGDL